MYASLIGAGISQLYDLYKDVTSKGGGGATSGASFPAPSEATPDTTSPAGTGGTGLSDAVQKLMVDLQNNAASPNGTAATDATKTVASDLRSVFKHAGSHAHAHAHAHAGGTGEAGASGQADPLGNVASSLLAYARNQALGTTTAGSTALTA